VRVDYLIAGRIGTTPLLRPGMAVWGGAERTLEAEACRDVGRGRAISNDKSFSAYDYYRSVWSSVMTEAGALLVICGLLVKAINGSAHPDRLLVATAIVPWAFVIFAAMTLVGIGMLRDGAYFARTSVRPAGRRAVEAVFARVGAADSWIALAVGIMGGGLVLGGVLLA
jgi:hypothetical protein